MNKTIIRMLLILAVIAVSVGVYLLLVSGDYSSIIPGGSSLPQPPSLPS